MPLLKPPQGAGTRDHASLPLISTKVGGYPSENFRKLDMSFLRAHRTMYTTGKLNGMWKSRFQIFLIDILEEKCIDNVKQEQKVTQKRGGGEGRA